MLPPIKLYVKQRSCKKQFFCVSLIQSGIESESTVLVADARSIRPLIGSKHYVLQTFRHGIFPVWKGHLTKPN